MNEKEILQALTQVFQDVFDDDDIVLTSETTADDIEIRAALARGFAAVRERIATGLVNAGYEAASAHATAALLLAAYEGGLLQARVAGTPEPMALVSAALLTYLKLQRPKEPDHE